MEPQPIPPEIEKRFLSALMEKCKRAKRNGQDPPDPLNPPSPS
jgi:hypothetical protein